MSTEKLTLDPYQDIGVNTLIANPRFILGDEPGLGKTAQAIRAYVALGAANVLVICLGNTKSQWADEAAKWGSTLPVTQVKGLSAVFEPKGLVIVNYELISGQKIREKGPRGGKGKVIKNLNGVYKTLISGNWDVIIVDEAHELRGHDSVRSMRILADNGLVSKARFFWALTGTPILTAPVNIFPLLRAIARPQLAPYDSYMQFTIRFCKGHQGKWGWDDSGASHQEELAARLKTIMLRRTNEELGKTTNPLMQAIVLDETDDVIKDVAKLKAMGDDPTLAEHIDKLNERLALQKVASSIAFIKNLLLTEPKIVVYQHHTAVARLLEAQLKKYGALTCVGTDTATKQQAAIKKFTTDKDCRVLIGHHETLGVGVDGLQFCCSCCIFIETPVSPEIMKQNIRRLDRRGQTKRVKAYALQYASQDTKIFERLAERTEVINNLLGTKQNSDLKTIKQGDLVQTFQFNVSTVLNIEAPSFEAAVAILAGRAVTPAQQAVVTPAAETTATVVEPPKGRKTAKADKEAAKPADIAQDLSDNATPTTDAKAVPTLKVSVEDAIKAMQTKTKEIMKNPKNQCDTMKFLVKLNEYLRTTYKVTAVPEIEDLNIRAVAAAHAVVLFNDMLGVAHGTLDLLAQ